MVWLSTLLACTHAPQRPSAGVQADDFQEFSLEVRGGRRSAWVHLPQGAKDAQKLPVVFAFHGGGGGGSGASIGKQFLGYLDQGMILVFPNGQQSRPEDPAWESKEHLDNPDRELVLRLLDEVSARYPVDPERVYAVGYSNGGVMVQSLACLAPERFAGFAVVSMTLHKDLQAACSPRDHRPFFYAIGTADPIYQGRDFSLNAKSTLDFWLNQGGCEAGSADQSALPDRYQDGTRVTATTWACRAGGALRYLEIAGGGHSWPGSDYAGADHCRDVSASDQIIDFFHTYAGL
jgi:polyhydroxybutyrate depolymerase